jgi:hypothetical protein
MQMVLTKFRRSLHGSQHFEALDSAVRFCPELANEFLNSRFAKDAPLSKSVVPAELAKSLPLASCSAGVKLPLNGRV